MKQALPDRKKLTGVLSLGKELHSVCPLLGVPLAVISVVLDYLLFRLTFRTKCSR